MSETTFATALDTLGEILPADPGRDAIHLATYAVVAGERLFPGQHIGLLDGDALQAFSTAEKLIGVVDPFLKATVFPGQMFWMVLYPRTITSLRHVWTHPDFSTEPKSAIAPTTMGAAISKEAAEMWMRKFTETADCPDYDTLMAALRGEWPDNGDDLGYYGFNWGGYDGDSLHFNGANAHSEIPPEFWDHAEVLLGRSIDPQRRARHFTCSC